ncbi:hypothetical protein NM208_g10584 [Fusarium decemcellulare]|uniref:Uncharacterized protein n=1 Tax=Fusarium decemcellulare TaxID=57161 RepID=A0ACC1RXF5_9HYPO|nr:hypothetical protein NM208_g10584 [Fusarium decemcellulare]
MGVGAPRLSPYNKLLSRLFEFLALFSILRKAEGPHVITNHDPSSLEATHRRFLRNLCFICDYEKGGDTTTAIAVEDQPDCFKFWVAANLTPTDKVIDFLSGVLNSLRGCEMLEGAQRQELKDQLIKDSIMFAASRLKKETKMLSNAANKCTHYLRNASSEVSVAELTALKNWLPQFKFNSTTDILPLCLAAYRSRSDPQMQTLQFLSREDNAALETAKAFRAVRHFVGRLAEHVRVPKQLVEDGSRLGTLLDSFRVGSIPAPPPAMVPPADGLTNLNSIAKRMLSAGEEGLSGIQHYLARLDEQTRLEDKIRTMYDRENSQPNVHAELQMLEFFHRSERSFVDNDRYIACSKLACLCCKLYFRHHPGRFREPDSHQKAYTNWRPILLHEGEEDPLFIEQRRILSYVSQDIRNLVKDEIVRQKKSGISQPDSVTNITASIDEPFDSSDFEFESLSDYGTDNEATSVAEPTKVSLDSDGDDSESDRDSDGGAAL